jgi:hypothetical protein
MKAQRRHELKQNTLAHSLETLPEFGRQHGTKILLVVLFGLLVVLLIRSRVASSKAAAEQAAYALGHGREMVEQLQANAVRLPPGQLASVARDVSKNVDQAVQNVLDSSDDSRMIAEARILQGDLNWQLVALPEPPGAATRPDLALPRTDEQVLDAAAAAYQAAVDERNAPRESVVTARLGLAAVAENRRQWDAAKDQYQKVLDDPATPKPLKDLAANSISRLEMLRKPPLIAAPASAPSTAAASQPSTTPSTTAPTPTTSQPSSTQAIPPATPPQPQTRPG